MKKNQHTQNPRRDPLAGPGSARSAPAPDPEAGIRDAKKALRAQIRKTVSGLSAAYREKADRGIFEHVVSLPEYQQACTIFCFVSMPDEADTRKIIDDALSKGKRVCVPRCEGKGIMNAYEIRSPERDLRPGKWSIPEPVADAPRVEPGAFDLALVPCCAASRDGRRLGFGGGFYDRYLLKTGAVRAVLCREQVLRDDIPTDSHDLTMDIVISERGVTRV